MQKQVVDVEQGIGQKYIKGHYEKPVPILVSATTGQTQAEIDASAQLTGEVSLNFRSETFPLEKMMTSGQLFQLNQAQSGVRGVPPTTTAAAAAPTASPPPSGAPTSAAVGP